MRSGPTLHKKAELEFSVSRGTSVDAGSNTSTVALRVVGDEEKGTQCLWA
jgi:hypothetical protein